jgi:hypothetical protein
VQSIHRARRSILFGSLWCLVELCCLPNSRESTSVGGNSHRLGFVGLRPDCPILEIFLANPLLPCNSMKCTISKTPPTYCKNTVGGKYVDSRYTRHNWTFFHLLALSTWRFPRRAAAKNTPHRLRPIGFWMDTQSRHPHPLSPPPQRPS